MIASMASDDPEGWDWYERTVRRAGEDFDIHILSNLNGVGNVEVNAFQRAARVVIQKSVREGFGLVVSEALWKGRPVVAGNVGGIPLQIVDGETGFLVNTPRSALEKLLFLLHNREEADRMGARGVEFVRGQLPDDALSARLPEHLLPAVGADMPHRQARRRSSECTARARAIDEASRGADPGRRPG